MRNRQWDILFIIWVLGAVGFPVAYYVFQVAPPWPMMAGYGGVVSVMLAQNTPKWRWPGSNGRKPDDEDDQ